MCFSASASFGAGAALLIVGVSAVKKTQVLSQVPFAIIPLIFSIQQFCEGFLWLSLTNPAYAGLQQPFTYIFLVFAQVIWPFWVPLSMFLIEEDLKRKKVLVVLLSFGTIISLCLIYCLWFFKVYSNINMYHISYYLDMPKHYYLVILSTIFYFISTVFPAFISGVKNMSIIGFTLLISYVITKIFFEENVTSVWCFFAAAISVVVLFIIVSLQLPIKQIVFAKKIMK